MGLSYEGGRVSSDNAFDTVWGSFRPILERIEAEAIEQDLIMRADLMRHPAVGREVLLETDGEGALRELLSDDRRYESLKNYATDSEPTAPYASLDILTEACQITVGRMWMWSARMRRVPRWSARMRPLWYLSAKAGG